MSDDVTIIVEEPAPIEVTVEQDERTGEYRANNAQ